MTFRRFPPILAMIVTALACAGCNQPPAPRTMPPNTSKTGPINTAPELWTSDVGKDGTWFIATEVVPWRPGEPLSDVTQEARLACMRGAMRMAIKEILEDPSKYEGARDTIERKLLDQPNNYIVESIPVLTQQWENNYGMKMKVNVDREKISSKLQEIGLIRQRLGEFKAVVCVYGGKNAKEDLVDDLARKLGEYLNRNGFSAVLWDEIKTDIAEERNMNEAATEAFLAKFVENPEFRGDEKIEGTLTLLRNRARVVIGYNVIKAAASQGMANAGVKAFAKDLTTGQIVADEQTFNTRIVPSGGDPDLAVAETAYETAIEVSKALTSKTLAWFDAQEKRAGQTGKTFVFIFKGYSQDELTRLSKLLREVFAGDTKMKQLDDQLIVEAPSTERILALQEKVTKLLKKNAMIAADVPIDSEATSVVFKKK